MLYYVNWWMFADILEKHNASFKQSKKSSWAAWPWRWRHCTSVKFWCLFHTWHGKTSQKTWIFKSCG